MADVLRKLDKQIALCFLPPTFQSARRSLGVESLSRYKCNTVNATKGPVCFELVICTKD